MLLIFKYIIRIKNVYFNFSKYENQKLMHLIYIYENLFNKLKYCLIGNVFD